MLSYLSFLKKCKEEEEFDPFISIEKMKNAINGISSRDYLWSCINSSVWTIADSLNIFEDQDTVEVRSTFSNRSRYYTYDIETRGYDVVDYYTTTPILYEPYRDTILYSNSSD